MAFLTMAWKGYLLFKEIMQLVSKLICFAFAGWWNKFAVLNNDFEDVKMKLFILTFDQDAMEWFTEIIIIHSILLNQL